MIFKPFSAKYQHVEGVLSTDFPDYMHSALNSWVVGILIFEVSEIGDRGHRVLRQNFKQFLDIKFREVFPSFWPSFLTYIFSDAERLCNILALCLQNYADREKANTLEYILREGGSAYEVKCIRPDAGDYVEGAYDLVERVAGAIKLQSEKALSENTQVLDAWSFCYSRNPDYEKVVSRCSDFLESLLGKIYFPNDPKPQLKKFVHNFESDPTRLSYRGDTIVTPKSLLMTLVKDVSNIRGQHTAGKGRMPTPEEAEFVLHTTIYIWNLHQK